MHKHNVNITGLTVGVKRAASSYVPFALLITWRERMPQTVINRHKVSRYGARRWKLLPILKENS